MGSFGINFTMNDLIECLENFKFTGNKELFEDTIDSITSKMGDLLFDSEDEWIILSQNYLKLKYISELIKIDFEESNKFNTLLLQFLESIDKVTQHYLRGINWRLADRDIITVCEFIEECLEESLNINNPVDKLNKIIEAYDEFVPIIEELRKEEVFGEINDTRFINNFSNLKKRKRN